MNICSDFEIWMNFFQIEMWANLYQTVKWTNIKTRPKTKPNLHFNFYVSSCIVRKVINKKTCEKAVRLTARGGGRGHPSPAWPLLFVKILGFFPIEYDSLIPKTDFTPLWRGWKMHFWCIFIAFLTAPRQLKPWISWSVSRSLQRNFRWSKNIFLVKLVLGHI